MNVQCAHVWIEHELDSIDAIWPDTHEYTHINPHILTHFAINTLDAMP